MRTPFSPLHLILFLVALGFLMAFIQVGVVTATFHKLGLSPRSACLLLLTSLFGSAINLPLYRIKTKTPPPSLSPVAYGLLRVARMKFTGETLIAVNVGGGLIPVCFSIYLFTHTPLSVSEVFVAVAVVAAVCYWLSRPIPGVGIGMPVLIAPVTAAMVAIVIGGDESAPLAYIAGTLGVLIGADLLRLSDVRTIGTPIASIGGAGTFDGIFLTGFVAVLLA